MLKISKDEAMYLVNNGVCWGEGGISHTYNKHHHYYLTENQKNIRLLSNFRYERKIN